MQIPSSEHVAEELCHTDPSRTRSSILAQMMIIRKLSARRNFYLDGQMETRPARCVDLPPSPTGRILQVYRAYEPETYHAHCRTDQIDHLDLRLPLWDAVRDLYSTDPS